MAAPKTKDNEIQRLKSNLKTSIKANIALKQNGKQPSKPRTENSSRKYTWDEQYGQNKDFSTREEFFTWLYTTPPEGKTKSRKNNLVCVSVKSANAMARTKQITARGKLLLKNRIFQATLQIQNQKRVSTKKQLVVLILGIPTPMYPSQYKIKGNVTRKLEIPRRKERWKLRLYLSTRMIPPLSTVLNRIPIPNETHCLIC